MLDEVWLKKLSFTAIENIKVEGLAGIGSNLVVLNATMPDGKRVVVKIPKTSIGLHIQEVPPNISLKPEYDLDRVNEKLRAMVGHPMLDKMSATYDKLYSKILHIISRGGIGGFLFSNMAPDFVETLPFILHSPALRRRLQEFAEWPSDPDDPLTMMPSVNGDEYPIRLMISPKHRDPWINEAIERSKSLGEWNKDLNPKSLRDNPLIVWGAAALEGFFTDQEMPKVASYLENSYGSFVDRPDVLTIIGQAGAMANLVAQFLGPGRVEKFVRLCACCGLAFQVRDMKGEIVADGPKML